MKQIHKDNFKSEVVEFKGVVIADFYADWCGPCKILSPLMENLDEKNKDKGMKFVKINVDEEQELAGLFGVMSIPTVIVFKDGKLVNQRVGVSSKEEYENLIQQAKSEPPARAKDGKNEIIVFTTPTCPYCHMTKSYLKEKHIEYKEIDVSRDQAWATKMVQKSGQMGVPQLWINGQTVVGFNKPQIDILLNL